MEEEERKKLEEPGTIKGRFKTFLERFVTGKGIFGNVSWAAIDGHNQVPDQHQAKPEKCYYKVLVNFLVELGETNLVVDFEHIMDYDMRLAIDILNHSNHLELELAVHNFAIDQMSDDIKRKVKQQMTLSFKNRPKKIISVIDLLKKPGAALSWFRNMLQLGEDACNLSDLMMALFSGFAEYIIDTHKVHRLSWRGVFDISHMFVIDNCRYIITVKPTFVLEGAADMQFIAKKQDLCQLPEIFTPFVDCKREDRGEGQSPPDSDLPLFYPQLRDVLVGVTEEDLNQKWFPEYVIYFPALIPGIARHHIVTDSYLVLKRDNVPYFLWHVVTEQLERREDWRVDIKESDIELLKEVYNYREPKGAPKQEIYKGGSHRAGGKMKPAASLEGTNEPFMQNTRGIITYDRHLRVHASDHVKVDTIAEVDAFSSAKLMIYLPDLLKRMLRDDLMKGDFKDIWTQYKNARIRTIDGSPVKPGPRFPCLD